MILLNLGCGRRFHPDWQNLDFSPKVDGVIAQNLMKPLPYADRSVDMCYAAHVLGHLPDGEDLKFLREMWRVLKPGGTVRLVVPDLQQIVTQYQELLPPLVEGDSAREADYDWNQIELYDQVNRSTYGGKMMSFLGQEQVPNRDYIEKRNGEECLELIDVLSGKVSSPQNETATPFPVLVEKARRKLAGILVGVVAGSGAKEAYEMGLFRTFSGEVQWRVYDQFSLARDLKQTGFGEVKKQTASESYLPDFDSYGFDRNEDKVERKPESLYLEAKKLD